MNSFTAGWLRDSWKRWIAWLVLASIFAVACVFLSQWQFSRRAEAVSRIELVQNNFNQPAIKFESLADTFTPLDEWRPVTLEGKFLPDSAVLVRNKPYNGVAGFLQVVPFETTSGKLVAVETGWLPSGNAQDSPDLIPLPDDQPTTVWGRFRLAEPTFDREAPAGQLATINVGSLVAETGISADIYSDFYVRLAEGYDPAAKLPKILPMPELGEGNHLSYAMQWILFALMAFGALAWAVRQELLIRREQADPNFKRVKRAKVGDADKAAEDSAIS